MLTPILAAVLPLVMISADDERLDSKRTFVSPAAEVALAADAGEAVESVLCIDRPTNRRTRSICLVRSEWVQAVASANAGEGRSSRLDSNFRDPSNSGYTKPSSFGLASSPSTFTVP